MQKRRVVLWVKVLNALDLIGLAMVLIIAFIAQFVFHELPCPLCLLQRLGLLAIGFGFLLNVRYDVRPSHYALSLLAAIFTAAVALRQICLHVVPGSGSYGSAVFGLHMYTWCFVLSMLVIVYIAIVMSVAQQYNLESPPPEKVSELKSVWVRRLGHLAFILFLALVVLNIVMIFLQCGAHECPDDPLGYILLGSK